MVSARLSSCVSAEVRRSSVVAERLLFRGSAAVVEPAGQTWPVLRGLFRRAGQSYKGTGLAQRVVDFGMGDDDLHTIFLPRR